MQVIFQILRLTWSKTHMLPSGTLAILFPPEYFGVSIVMHTGKVAGMTFDIEPVPLPCLDVTPMQIPSAVMTGFIICPNVPCFSL